MADKLGWRSDAAEAAAGAISPGSNARIPSKMTPTSRWLWAVTTVLVAGSLQGAEKPVPRSAGRWTAATPDEMLEFALRRAAAGGDDALAGLVTAHALSD